MLKAICQKVICQLINTVALTLTFLLTPTCLVGTVGCSVSMKQEDIGILKVLSAREL